MQVNQGKLQLQTVNLSALATEVTLALRQSQPDRIVAVEIQADVTAQCDSRLARTVLENLLGNAWKYSQHGFDARVPFGCRAGNATEPPWLYVQDNGVGFDMAYAEKRFKPFHRLHHHQEFEGSGIGLATVHRLSERHGGSIQGWGEPGRGAESRFSFSAPDLALSAADSTALKYSHALFRPTEGG